jgi:uncharacterized HhH-GPD family protein
MTTPAIRVTGIDEADELLSTDPLALVIGMLLDQQIPMEWAFKGPATLRDRLGGLDATAIAAMDPDAFVEVFSTKPALHRFPGSMGRRTHELCVHITDTYGGDAAAIWTGIDDADELMGRVRAMHTPDGLSVRYTRDPGGRVTEEQRPDRVITRTYDAADQIGRAHV